jgi:DNA-binding CsgD family transcriptional regulator
MLNRFFTAGLILVGIITIIGITTYMNTGSNAWIINMYRGVVISAMIAILTANISLLRSQKAENNNKKLKSLRIFGGLNLLGYFVFFGSSPLQESLGLYISTVALLFLNFIPIVWLKKYFVRHYVKLTTDASSQFLDVALQRYQVSNREREIMELILQGKSNKEIEDVLFISYNTVKNHIYNLYQKLGVKSRGQLINFVLEARRSIER